MLGLILGSMAVGAALFLCLLAWLDAHFGGDGSGCLLVFAGLLGVLAIAAFVWLGAILG